MSELTIRKVENGYVITEIPGQYEDDLCYVARTDKDMVDHVTEFFFGGVLDLPEVVWSQDLKTTSAPEQPKDTSSEDSTLSIDDSLVDPETVFCGDGPTAETIEPMTDLSVEESKVDWQTGLIKPEFMNGSLPETD